ncbi:MAG TPA: hypothetical protein PKC48_12230 [Sphingorhabdus sp.]|nr:hypothetical protein [Sphingorhabdus sp.]HMT42702.1 hypothetical protein [Sphingorhabdus sp.]HMU23055.1 hypothetical protein [Sphingorhabdus sp.]
MEQQVADRIAVSGIAVEGRLWVVMTTSDRATAGSAQSGDPVKIAAE